MNSINFVLLGDYSIAQQLGKKGTTTDITIYDRKTADTVFTWTAPVTFPEKIQSLMQAVNIAEYAILNAAKLDRFLGEQIVALDFAGFSQGFVMHSYEVDRERLKSTLKTTSLVNFEFVESVDQLKEQMAKLVPKGADGPLLIQVDHAFDVKGVGTVILGVVKQGAVNVYDELTLKPAGKGVVIKSIQMHDDPVQTSRSPARVGLAIKGVSADDISRGDMICAPDASTMSTSTLSLKFMKSEFFKGDMPENQPYLVSVGMQIRPAKITRNDGENLELSLERPVEYMKCQTCVLLKPDNLSTRIVGKGNLR